jgi:predicted HTH domain antitoxin
MAADTVQVELPVELAELLAPGGEHLADRVREALIWKLFIDDEISAGRAAELLGLSNSAFRDLHQQRGVPYFRQAPEDLLAEIKRTKPPTASTES